MAEDPVEGTPAVLDGEVRTIARAGRHVVVGGSFSQVRESRTGGVLDRAGLFAFDAATGNVVRGCHAVAQPRPVPALRAKPLLR
ncbi:MAG: hypothetical protein ACRDZ3_21830 [Acidimicrobiia bacterium]